MCVCCVCVFAFACVWLRWAGMRQTVGNFSAVNVFFFCFLPPCLLFSWLLTSSLSSFCCLCCLIYTLDVMSALAAALTGNKTLPLQFCRVMAKRRISAIDATMQFVNTEVSCYFLLKSVWSLKPFLYELHLWQPVLASDASTSTCVSTSLIHKRHQNKHSEQLQLNRV